jgi:cell wall-associated NlpC family hydrolase
MRKAFGYRPFHVLPILVTILMAAVISGCAGSKPSVTAPAGDTVLGQKIVGTARGFIGTPYRYGGQSPSGFDCSGLTSYVFGQYGYRLPRRAQDQLKVGAWVPKEDLRPGDLVFFRTSASGFHVGIFVGRDRFIHAPSSGKKVETQRLDAGYYRRNYYTARRVLHKI